MVHFPIDDVIDVLELVIGGRRYQSDREKAKALIDIFFSTLPMLEASNNITKPSGRAEPIE